MGDEKKVPGGFDDEGIKKGEIARVQRDDLQFERPGYLDGILRAELDDPEIAANAALGRVVENLKKNPPKGGGMGGIG